MITILIVDDEKLERRGIRFLLKREEGEFQILEATNGKDALGVLESNHVDILFSDVKMPYMNGLELTKAVREDPRSNEWKGCTGSIRIKPCGYFIFGCKDALYEWTGADESSERRS